DHVFNGSIIILRRKIHRLGSVCQHSGLKAFFDGIQNCEFHAIISRQTGHHHLFNAIFLQIPAPTGIFPSVIVEKTTVTIHIRIGALLDNSFPSCLIKVLMEFSTGGTLHAMYWPEHLIDISKLYKIAGILSLMIGRKTAVAGRVPILGSDNKVKLLLQLIDHRNDLVAFLYR